MNDLNIIDQFMLTFVAYIDSGFGLLTPDVSFLTTILIGIDITMAGLYWAMADDKSVIPALIKKVLYVGVFAYIIGNFQFLANVIFESFAGLGLNATGTGLTITNLLRPGFIAATGYDAAAPILEEVGNLIGPIAFFENFVTIFVLCFAWFVVLITFFVLSIQLFITILEFKLTALAGFVLIPFALWGKTSFLAEKVIGNIVSSGIKLMVLAIIVGIGSTIFSSFSSSFVAGSITLEQALSTVLASMALFMLGIFGPGVAAGLISGAPQLGAGAVAGSALGLGLGTVAAVSAVGAGAKLAGSAAGSAVKAGSSMAGGASTAYNLGKSSTGSTGAAGVAAGVSGVARAGVGAASQGMSKAASNAKTSMQSSFSSGEKSGFTATGGSLPMSDASFGNEGGSDAAPEWANNLKRSQHIREGVSVAAHTLRDGDRGGAGGSPVLKEGEE